MILVCLAGALNVGIGERFAGRRSIKKNRPAVRWFVGRENGASTNGEFATNGKLDLANAADIGSRTSKAVAYAFGIQRMAARNKNNDSTTIKDMRRTPPFLFAYLNRVFNFDVDLACTTENKLLPVGFTYPEMDSLQLDWSFFGDVGFCNPPYSDVTPWFNKAIEQKDRGFTSVFLIPTINGDSYAPLILDHAVLSFIVGRLAFHHAETNEPQSGNERGSMVAVFSNDPKRNAALPKYFFRDEAKQKYA